MFRVDYDWTEMFQKSITDVYSKDKARYGKNASFLSDHSLRFLWVFRHAQDKNNILWRLVYRYMRSRYGLEIPYSTQIGPGLYLGHAYNITVNASSRIGKNCNLHKGVTIGQESRGKRKGAPTIGDCVWVGVNSTIVGSVSIGDDVLIAPNSFVNCDVPSHSIVLGSPCIVIPRQNATLDYVIHQV